AMKVTTDGCLFGAWVAEQIQKDDIAAGSILDIGAGTGVLSLMLAQKTNAKIHAIEIDENAATQTAQNFAASPWHDRLHVINEDVHLFNPSTPYEIIISNPPFYENDLTGNNKQKNIAHHDAGLLLQDLIRIISTQLTSQNGHFFLLLPEKRLDETLLMIRQRQLAVHKICKVRQSVDHGVFRALVHGTNNSHNEIPVIEELSVRNNNNQYTEAFEALLRDYYLYL
ncbi:MAG: methyltransferase, partial [Chitinophagaceae bacterium]|nr:methyltransferase [Chitinophagaceae bacterium]